MFFERGKASFQLDSSFYAGKPISIRLGAWKAKPAIIFFTHSRKHVHMGQDATLELNFPHDLHLIALTGEDVSKNLINAWGNKLLNIARCLFILQLTFFLA